MYGSHTDMHGKVRYDAIPWDLTEDGLFRYPMGRYTLDELMNFDYIGIAGYIVKTQFQFFSRGVTTFTILFAHNRQAELCTLRQQVPGLGTVVSVYDTYTEELIAQKIER